MSQDRMNWELCNIGMVNWYLFGEKDIETRGKIALTGPNGAGKSSILDAIQTVMTGRSGRHLQLNSLVQTDRGEKGSRRTVRDYCLGTIDDAEDGLSSVRDHALSYLLLGFRHSKTRKEVTVGLCLAASKSQPDEDVIARLIVEGKILRAADVSKSGVDDEGEWSEARPWDEVAAGLKKAKGVTLSLESGPELFVRAICRVLGPEHGEIDPQKFLRNLKNASAFKPVDNTTDFVRRFILDAQPLNLTDLRESISRYKVVQEKIEDLKDRLSAVEELRDRGNKAKTRTRTLAKHRLNFAQGRLFLAATEWEEARNSRDATARELSRTSSSIPVLEKQVEQRFSELEAARSLMDTSSVAVAVDATKGRLRLLEERRKLLSERGANFLRTLRQAASLVSVLEDYNPDLAATCAQLGDLGNEEDIGERLEELDIPSLVELLKSTNETIYAEADASRKLVGELENEVAVLEETLARTRTGSRILGRNTQVLLAALADEGISAEPICDLVTAVEPEWRNVIEAILGEAREALIVDPDAYERALAVYRRSGLTGGFIVNTARISGARASRKASLAQMVKTTDKRARAFIDYRLGGIEPVETESELRASDSAATQDMMFTSGRATRKMRMPERLVLGVQSAQESTASLTEGLSVYRARLSEQLERSLQFKTNARTLNRFIEQLDDFDFAALSILSHEMRAISSDITRAGQELQDYAEGDDESLKIRYEEAEARWREAMSAKEKASNLEAALTERLASRAESVRRAQDADVGIREQARQIVENSVGILSEEELDAAESWIAETIPDVPFLETSGDDASGDMEISDNMPLETALKKTEILIDYHHKRLESERPNFLLRIGTYVNVYGLHQPEFIEEGRNRDDGKDRFQEGINWVEHEAEVVCGNILRDYESQAKIAYEDAIVHFKGDFIGKMRGAFEAISGRLRELNRQLAKRDFHGLTYRFEKNPAAAYKDMIALIEASSSPDFEQMMSGERDTMPSHARRALEHLEAIALNPEASIEDIEDPRRYFEFDISMAKDGIERTTMSKRLGTGSGGQVQVPFYVAICAALAATYYPDRNGLDGGLSLSIFDEAFNRMDTAVIKEVIQFMGDVGLQPFIAAPDKERSTFMQFVDTMIGLSRSGKAVSIDVQYLKPYAHERFQKENPSLVGFQAFQEQSAS